MRIPTAAAILNADAPRFSSLPMSVRSLVIFRRTVLLAGTQFRYARSEVQLGFGVHDAEYGRLPVAEQGD